jgi:hypothetical protein
MTPASMMPSPTKSGTLPQRVGEIEKSGTRLEIGAQPRARRALGHLSSSVLVWPRSANATPPWSAAISASTPTRAATAAARALDRAMATAGGGGRAHVPGTGAVV